MMAKMVVIGVAAIVGYILADYMQPKIAGWLKLSADNSIGVKAVKYGSLGGFVVAVYWGMEKFLKVG